MKFTEFAFNENLQKGIAGAGFEDCTPVQAETFKFLFEGRDIYAQSQTGTGKTGAFIISAFHLMAEHEDFKGKKTLVIAPTRELAVQIEKEAELLGKEMDFNIGSFYGGVGYNSQEKKLSDGCDLVIGTPGRLIDFGKSGKIDYKEFGICIIDEADRLFDMGFLPDLRNILRRMPPREERRTMLYSATLSSKVGNLAWEHLNNPGEIVIEPENVTVDAITQELYHVGTNEKMQLLLGILKKENPETAIVFTNTKHTAYEVSKRLEHNGYRAECLMGDLPQKKRLRIVEDTKAGKVKFLVATDVAARGLHIDDLAMVVNYDIPQDCENYVHRIGRTARAGKSGKAISLACEKYVYGLPAVEKYIDLKIPVAWADESLFVEDKSEGMRFHLRDSNSRADRNGRGRRDDNRNRPGNRGGNRPANRDRDRNRDGNRDRNRPANKKYPSNRRPLEQSEKHVQNLVLEASGGLDLLKDGSKPQVSQGKKNESRNIKRSAQNKKSQNRNYRKSSGDQKPKYNKNAPSRTKQDPKRVSGKNNINDRLAYYRDKYGEDFKVDEKTVKVDKERQRKNTKKKIDKKPEKKGFLSRIFGK
ncbi:DEAD/DEAH box helicase [Spirochaeta isovalerica]|uniref:ATP-dependent RNA helicase RhlB n=1 Tax=Spirochaeta isovalerica TaxID=150 RepID=A0A841RAS6_9SPIO|nr:DEAD/DEAH box helicase [Spirochaeta isovalerica]MBB6480816.1 ATP-dependent RNA helicase RhlB [Spirochaeta isovalerica]